MSDESMHLGLSQFARDAQLLCPGSDTSEAACQLSLALHATILTLNSESVKDPARLSVIGSPVHEPCSLGFTSQTGTSAA